MKNCLKDWYVSYVAAATSIFVVIIDYPCIIECLCLREFYLLIKVTE